MGLERKGGMLTCCFAVKVLGQGDISVALTVTVDKVSASAEEKIVAAGGTVTK